MKYEFCIEFHFEYGILHLMGGTSRGRMKMILAVHIIGDQFLKQQVLNVQSPRGAGAMIRLS